MAPTCDSIFYRVPAVAAAVLCMCVCVSLCMCLYAFKVLPCVGMDEAIIQYIFEILQCNVLTIGLK